MKVQMTASSLAERYRRRSTEDLVRLAETGDLNEVAQNLVVEELALRGTAFVPKVERTPRAPPPRPVPSTVGKLGDQLPSTGIGYGLGVLALLLGLSQEPRGMALAILFAGVAAIYWLYCIGKIHSALRKWTRDSYPIGPVVAIVLHLIPIFSCLWVFVWPWVLGKELRERGVQTWLGAMLGLPILLGYSAGAILSSLSMVPVPNLPRSYSEPVRLLGALGLLEAIGVFILFFCVSEVNSALRKADLLEPLKTRSFPARRMAIPEKIRRKPEPAETFQPPTRSTLVRRLRRR